MSTRPTIHVRVDQLTNYRAIAKVGTAGALADRMGVHPDTVRRTLSGRTALTVEFIAALMSAFPEVGFGDLFAIDSDTVAERVPA